MLSGSIVQEIWHTLGQSSFRQGSPRLPYLCSLPANPSSSIRPSPTPPTDEAGVPWATVWYTVQPWLIPSLRAELSVLWENSRSLKTKSEVFHAEEGLQMKVAGASLISDIS